MVNRAFPMVAQTLDISCGAACFDSMVRFVTGSSPGELFFIKRLGIEEIGYASIERMMDLAQDYGFKAELKTGCVVADLIQAESEGHILYVTWWFDDAGHYSLVRSIDNHEITLMDPWAARDGSDTIMSLDDFVPLWMQRGGKLIVVDSKNWVT